MIPTGFTFHLPITRVMITARQGNVKYGEVLQPITVKHGAGNRLQPTLLSTISGQLFQNGNLVKRLYSGGGVLIRLHKYFLPVLLVLSMNMMQVRVIESLLKLQAVVL